MINVVLVSSQPLLCLGMRCILAPHHDLQVLGSSPHPHDIEGGAAVADVVVLAATTLLHGADEVLADLQQRYRSARIVMIVRCPTLQQVLAALRADVRGLLSSQCTEGDLPGAIRTVAAGRIYLHDDVARIVGADLDGIARDRTHGALTGREFDILVRLAGGGKVTTIAHQMGISVKTVSTHKTRLMEKMGFDSLSQLVQYAIGHRLVVLPRAIDGAACGPSLHLHNGLPGDRPPGVAGRPIALRRS